MAPNGVNTTYTPPGGMLANQTTPSYGQPVMNMTPEQQQQAYQNQM